MTTTACSTQEVLVYNAHMRNAVNVLGAEPTAAVLMLSTFLAKDCIKRIRRSGERRTVNLQYGPERWFGSGGLDLAQAYAVDVSGQGLHKTHPPVGRRLAWENRIQPRFLFN